MTTLTKAMFWLGLSMAAVGARPPSALAEPELGRDEIAAIVRNGIDASLMTAPEKTKARAEVDGVLVSVV